LLEFDKIKIAGANYALTKPGKERFLSLSPDKDSRVISKNLELLGQLLGLFDRGEKPPLEGFCDMAPFLKKLSAPGAFLEGGELLVLSRGIIAVEKLKKFLSKHREVAPALWETFSSLTPLPELASLIDAKIDDEGNVKENASSELKKLYKELGSAEKGIQNQLTRMVQTLGAQKLLQESYHTLRGNRYVLPVRSSAKSRVSGIVHDVSGTGETVFIEPMEIVESSNHLATIKLQIRNEITRILAEISDRVREHMDDLQTNASLITDFDFLHAKARFSHANNFAIPEISSGSELKLVRAHHPLLYLKEKTGSVPLNLNLNSEDRVLVITGPNAGGKTTALKTVGLLSLMVQSGLAIPAYPDSCLPLFQGWFADIGDAQDITEGISTFSAHIGNMREILKNADKKSLVLLDELGTATDPIEGGCLAVSILEELGSRAALTIATSHLSPLKAWAHDFPPARNASFRLDDVTHEPTFQIMLDVPGASEALLIAKREGLPEKIMHRARKLLPKGEADLSGLVSSLRKKEQEIEQNRKEISRLLKEQKKLRHHITELQDFLKEKERRLEQDMLEAKQELLKEARMFIEKQVANLPTRKAVVQARKEITKEIQKVEKRQRQIKETYIETVDPDQFAQGMTVYVSSLNEFGEILEIDRVKLLARLTLKGMEVTIPLSGLKIPVSGEVPPKRGSKISYSRKQNVPFELDLHGMRVEEMLSVVEQYLNDALLGDLPYVRLLHGVGTGALRKALHEYLKTHPLVKKYHYGTPEEGGGGVTIVKFS